MGRQPTTGYENEEIPDSMPPQNQGAIPVLVRLVDGELGGPVPCSCIRVVPVAATSSLSDQRY